MLIAHVFFKVRPGCQQQVLSTLVERADDVRAMSGCLLYLPFVDETDHTRIGVMHEWRDQATFKNYLESAGFLALRQTLQSAMSEPPVSRRFDACLIDTVQ